MNRSQARLRPGDLVEVKAPDEILRTLDAQGALDRLPFMPEMVEFCGRRFRVARRVVKTCFTGTVSTMRVFESDDVVTLEGLRCSGAAHDGCQKACTIFWREGWLRKVDDAGGSSTPRSDGASLRSRLKISTGPTTYYCQASELWNATKGLSRWARIGKCVAEVRAGNCSALHMVRRIAIWFFWRVRRTLVGEYARGPHQVTPVESLDLRPGELVEVKPMESIIQTLNETARNRGLYFSPDMRRLCNSQRRVKERIEDPERMLVEV